MTDQQRITEYPTVTDAPDPTPVDDVSGEPVRFDLTDDSSSIERARDTDIEIDSLTSGTYLVTFADGDHDHEVDPLIALEWGGWEDLETFLDHYKGAYSPAAQRRAREKVDWL